MARRIGKKTILLDHPVTIVGYGSVVGKMEGKGPYGGYFDQVIEDSRFGEDTFEQAESKLQKTSVGIALQRAGLAPQSIDSICAGDLLNQCISSSFGLKEYEIPLLGVYGACSTMALSLIIQSLFMESGAIHYGVSVTSSHFCSAERQYRFPLDYGSLRPPTAQWTVTGSGAMVLADSGNGPKIRTATIGTVIDPGIIDQNNMGAAMAPRDVKIRPYPKNEGMVFFYTQIKYLGGDEYNKISARRMRFCS